MLKSTALPLIMVPDDGIRCPGISRISEFSLPRATRSCDAELRRVGNRSDKIATSADESGPVNQ